MSKTITQVLYLSYDGLTDPLGQSQILPYLCALSGNYEITIISFEKKERFAKGYDSILEICKRHGLKWIPLMYHKTPPVISTVYDLYKLRNMAKKLHRTHIFSIIHCRSYLTSLVGLWMKRHCKVKFIFDMRGFWADERVDGGLWNLHNPFYAVIYKFFKRKERGFIQEADHVISLTNNAKKEIATWGINTNITVIPCCVDLDLFAPEKINQHEKEKLKAELGIKPDDFVLLYLGSWGTWYMTTEMLDFFSELREQRLKLKFLIVTGDKVDIRDYPFVSDVIIREAPRSKIPLFISIADSAVFFIKATYSKKASSATKMAEIMAMNVPVITNSGWGDAEEILKDSTGWLYEKGLTEFRIDKVEGSHIDTRDYCSRNLSLEVGVAKYHAVYRYVMQS